MNFRLEDVSLSSVTGLEATFMKLCRLSRYHLQVFCHSMCSSCLRQRIEVVTPVLLPQLSNLPRLTRVTNTGLKGSHEDVRNIRGSVLVLYLICLGHLETFFQ